jgi:hypothetical protein
LIEFVMPMSMRHQPGERPSRREIDEQVAHCNSKLLESDRPALDLVQWAAGLACRSWPDQDVQKFLVETVGTLSALGRSRN